MQGLVSDVRRPWTLSRSGRFGLLAKGVIALEHSRLER